jgi:hypothetical protein
LLPRPWPLLREGQDPDSLEARVAFHLHRLKLVGRALRQVGFHPADAADLAAARLPMSRAYINYIARVLEVAPAELQRDLTSSEQREWDFYRASAANPRQVWRNARDAWRAASFTDLQAADILKVQPALIRRAASGTGRPVTLSFERAVRLSTALNIFPGPEAFLPSPPRDNEPKSR